MSDLIQAILIDWRYLEPQNLLLIILILATIVTSSLLVYFLQRRHIPKLVLDGVWKNNDNVVPTAIIYFLRIKRENGEGGIRGFRGFVGVKDKFEPKISQLLSKNSEIFLNDYLYLFKVFEYNGKNVITFSGIKYLSDQDTQPTFENAIYEDYKECELIVNVDAIRGRIPKKRFMEKIDNIVKNAKQIPP